MMRTGFQLHEGNSESIRLEANYIIPIITVPEARGY